MLSSLQQIRSAALFCQLHLQMLTPILIFLQKSMKTHHVTLLISSMLADEQLLVGTTILLIGTTMLLQPTWPLKGTYGENRASAGPNHQRNMSLVTPAMGSCSIRRWKAPWRSCQSDTFAVSGHLCLERLCLEAAFFP